MAKMEKKRHNSRDDTESFCWITSFKTKVKDGGFLDWDYVVNLLENEEPFWTPGEQTGYHMMTTGWLIGEIIRRISGKSLRKIFQR